MKRVEVRAAHRRIHLVNNEIDHAVQNVFLVGHVVVERHGLDSELLADPAHADGVDPAFVCKSHSGAKNALPAQRRARLGARFVSYCHRFPPAGTHATYTVSHGCECRKLLKPALA